MDSVNNEVCEFNSTPITENFSCEQDSNCSSGMKCWSWSQMGYKCT